MLVRGVVFSYCGGEYGQSFDYIITVCDRANETCLIFPGDPKRIHWSFPDPTAVDEPKERSRIFIQGFCKSGKSMATILIVEDEQQVRQLLATILTPEYQDVWGRIKQTSFLGR